MQPVKLSFFLRDNPFGENLTKIQRINEELQSLPSRIGTGGERCRRAYSRLLETVRMRRNIADEIDSPIDIRALVAILNSESDQGLNRVENMPLSASLYQKIDRIRPKPSFLMVTSLYRYYLKHYDNMPQPEATAQWLLKALSARGQREEFHDRLLAVDGPRWLARQAVRENRQFSEQVRHLKLDRQVVGGRFLTVAQTTYFIEQLQSIPANEPDPMLDEVIKRDVFQRLYEDRLLGHKIMEVLIDRAPDAGVHEDWQNVVLAIGGDPRVPRSHKNYQQWWSKISFDRIQKMRGWLTKLDVKLFLEAMENYADTSNNEELQRMFPARKRFLDGMYNKGLITHSRLYFSCEAEKYLKKNYQDEELSSFSSIDLSDHRSIIYLKVGDFHIIEGTHNCFLWIYKNLHETALVNNYEENKVTYRSLTNGLNETMELLGISAVARIQHNPAKYSWQRTAIRSLKKIGVPVSIRDVLNDADYRAYKRIYGIGE